MAANITINNLPNDIEFVYAGTTEIEKDTIPKLGLRTKIYGDKVQLVSSPGNLSDSSAHTVLVIDYNKVVAPAVASATELRDLILLYASSAAGGGGGGIGGGSIVYTNAADDFVATINNGTKTITITGLPFTLEAKHVYAGSIKKQAVTTDLVTDVAITKVSVAGGVITVANESSNFVTGDEVVVTLIGPDKHYDRALDTDKSTIDNPGYAHHTDPNPLVDETDLGIDGEADPHAGAPTLVFQETDAVFSPENVAEGFTIYNATDGSSALINVDGSGIPGSYHGDGGAGYDSNAAGVDVECISHAALAGGGSDDWQATEVACIPECKRFVIDARTYPEFSFDTLLRAGDNNKVWLKIYSSNDASADTTDDTGWKDKSLDVLGAATISADNLAATGVDVYQSDTYVVDEDVMVLKWMIKIVGEFNAAAAQDNSASVIITKGY